MKCFKCLYWNPHSGPNRDEYTSGLCHRYPPKIDQHGVYSWPRLTGYLWCGEFTPYEESHNATPTQQETTSDAENHNETDS